MVEFNGPRSWVLKQRYVDAEHPILSVLRWSFPWIKGPG